MSRLMHPWTVLLALALFAAACAEPPTQEGGADAGEGEGGEEEELGEGDVDVDEDDLEGMDALQDVYDELDGLEGDERTDRLVELAQDEAEEMGFYGSTNIDDVGPIIEEYEDEYELSVSHYRAGASTVLQRILQETDAGFAGADVVQINGPEMLILDNEGLLAPLETPVRDDILEAGQFDNWLAAYVNTFITGWNTDRVSDEDRPTTWDEVLEYEGDKAFDVDDFDWFHTLTTRYFEEELGWDEEETVEAFKEAMRGGNAQVIRGHSLGAELLGAGEFDLHASMYHHHLPRLEDTPAEWEPPIEPVVVRPNGVGILGTTNAPAQALLFTEFMLTRGQEIFAEVHRTPGSTTVEGGLPDDVESVGVDLDELDENREHWEGLWAEIVEETGEEVRE